MCTAVMPFVCVLSWPCEKWTDTRFEVVQLRPENSGDQAKDRLREALVLSMVRSLKLLVMFNAWPYSDPLIIRYVWRRRGSDI